MKLNLWRQTVANSPLAYTAATLAEFLGWKLWKVEAAL
jgi:hypothetical protein